MAWLEGDMVLLALLLAVAVGIGWGLWRRWHRKPLGGPRQDPGR